MAKKKKKDDLSGFNNNITVFVLTLLLSFFQGIIYKPTLATSCVCTTSGNLDCGYTDLKFNYTPGIIHIILVVLLAILFVGTIAYSIYIIFFDKKKKKKYEIVLNIIFAMLNIVYIYIIPYNTIKADIKYGTEIQIPDQYNTDCKRQKSIP